MKVTDFLVSKSDLTETRVDTQDAPELAAGEFLVEIEKFAFTANNITYAVMGAAMQYWDFFPAPDGWGRIPVWGYATVVQSNLEGVEVGERLYGYFPMSSHVVLRSTNVSPSIIHDTSDYRSELAPFYNQYNRLTHDPMHDSEREGERMVFGPLYLTSHLIERSLNDADWHGAKNLIVTSASSKTALALEYVTKARNPDIHIIGLTSAGNIAFVKGLGFCHSVGAYDGIDHLPEEPSVYVDFAGNADTLHAIHNRLGGNLKKGLMVGATDWQGRGELPEPAPELFFAPSVAADRIATLGPAAFAEETVSAWKEFSIAASDMLKITELSGETAVQDVYLKTLNGQVSPTEGLILTLAG